MSTGRINTSTICEVHTSVNWEDEHRHQLGGTTSVSTGRISISINWVGQYQYQLGGSTTVPIGRVDTSVSWKGKWQQGLQCRCPGLQSAHYQQAAALRRCLAAPGSAATAAAGPSHLHGVHPSLWTQLQRGLVTTGKHLTLQWKGSWGDGGLFKLG